MLYVGVTLTAFCLALCVLAIVWAGRERIDADDVERAERVREEDLVRPAIDPDGRPTWVTPGEVVWHEIVEWPLPTAAGPDVSRRRRRTG